MLRTRAWLFILAAACGKPASAPPSEPRRFTEEEIARYEAGLAARLAENAKRWCVRPVVLEPGTDTAATADLIARDVPTGSLATCLKAFGDLSKQPGMTTATLVDSRPPEMVALDATCGAELVNAVGTGDAVATAPRIRGAIVQILASVAHPAFSTYVGRHAESYARLAALRVHLEVLRAGRCPTELAETPYALLSPATLGDALVLRPIEGGDLEVSTPAWIDSMRLASRISCPPR